MRDVVLGHAERAAQHERLEHRGVEPAVGLRHAGERVVGDRLVLQRQAERLLDGSCPCSRTRTRSSPAGGSSSLRVVELLDLEVAHERRRGSRSCLSLSSFRPVSSRWVGKIEQARVVERAEQHQHVAVLALAADLLGVHARGLVAVVAVGDQQLGVGERAPGARRSARGRRPARACCACPRGRSPSANGSPLVTCSSASRARAARRRGRG